MTETNPLPVESRIDDRVLFVTIRRAAKRNTLSSAVLSGLRDIFTIHAGDHSLVAAVLTGEGDRAFAAGGDLHEFDAARSRDAAETLARLATEALDSVRRFPVPVVAVLNGDALGGGSELAVACDFRILASHARIGFIQAELAIPTGWGGGGDLARLVGGRAALDMLVRAQKFDSRAALAAGLADLVAEEGCLTDALDSALSVLRSRSPQVLRAIKAVTRPSAVAAMSKLEFDHFVDCWLHPDHWAAHDAIVGSLGAKRD